MIIPRLTRLAPARLALPGALLLMVLLAGCSQIPAMPWARPSGGGGVARTGEALPLPAGSAGQAGAPVTATVVSTPGAAAPAQAQATPTADRAVRGSVAVRRGPIAEELLMNGRIVGVDEVSLSFPAGGTVRAIPVDPGQTVQAGQMLMELDSRQLIRERDAARARLETSVIRLQQAQARVQAQLQLRLREQERRQREAERRQQTAIAEAERAYNRAVADLELVKAGPTAAERSAAEAAVVAARANLERVRLEQGRLTRGPEPDEVRAAESQLASAEAQYMAAQAELERLRRGAAPEDVRAAERNVERAQIALQAARAAPTETTSSGSRAAAIAAAELNLREAQERLAVVRSGPAQAELDAARRRVDATRLNVESARLRLERLGKGPDEQTAAVARAALASAEAAVASAEARVAELNSRPTPAELQDAAAKVALAAQALEFARAAIDLPVDEDDSAVYDVLAAQKVVEQERAQLEQLERELAATRLVAPFAGVVVAVRAQSGATVEAGRPVLVLARQGQPIVEASLFDADAARIARGQRATVQVDGGDGTRLSATVLDFVRSPVGAGTIARLGVDWSNTFPAFGATTRVRIAVQERADALLVPRLAIRTAGDRQYVEYLDNGVRRTAEVEVGIVTAEAAEILSGLEEGQLVLIGP